MLGQLWVEPVPVPDPEDELEEPELELEEPELEVPEEPPVPLLVDGVVVEELEVELVPELPVVVEVVAALATSAPPARRPEVSAPMASTLRRRICMGGCPFVSRQAPARSGRHRTRCTPDLAVGAERPGRVRGVA